MKLRFALLLSVVGLCLASSALDRWAALSQIESGDNDKAVGRMGEISRYQILPDVWAAFAPDTANWENSQDALAVAKEAKKALRELPEIPASFANRFRILRALECPCSNRPTKRNRGRKGQAILQPVDQK